MSSVLNTLKVKQIDTADLTTFVLSLLGNIVTGGLVAHAYDETFEGSLSCYGPFVDSGNCYISGQTYLKSGLTSDSGIIVHGLISGDSLAVQNFNLASGTFQTINIGSMKLTGVPIYASGSAGTAVLLPSGTIFGLRQTVNAPQWELDASGQLMPATGLGVSLVTLCVSVGS
jgi:hypothetical protein